jgi:branched-chain amino acid transport system ATP-binding protein
MLLSVKDVWAAYDSIDVLKGVSFDLHQSASLAICGPNGMGKSTLLKTIVGLVRDRKGTITLNGEDISSLPAHLLVKKGISLVPEGRQILTQQTVEENLKLGGYILSSRTRKTMIEKVLYQFPLLKERINQLAGSLSGGEQQLLAIARALMSGAKFLLIDEPFLGLSPGNIEMLRTMLAEINRSGIAILVVDEDKDRVSTIVQNTLYLDKGVLSK